MWNRRYLPVVVLFFIIGVVLFQLHSEKYTTKLLYGYGRKRTSRLHLLIPASSPHVQLCRTLISSAALGYPPAVLSGWNGTGELDASVTHLAKVRNVMRYLDSFPPSDNDDLVLIIDGYDVIMQLPPDVMIERYFAIIEAANAKLAVRLNVTAEGAGDEHRPRQSILFNPDKLCWPVDFRRPACWAVPETGIPDGVFGQGDDVSNNQPKWLNSGAIIGPIGDLRDLFAATLERIRKTYDPEYICRESDQMYMSDVWGEQEYARSMQELALRPVSNTSKEVAASGEEEKWIPVIEPGQRTEFHIGLDYESALFQAWAGYERFVDLLTFNGTGATALVTRNSNNNADFKPYEIALTSDVASSITRLLRSISHIHNINPNDTLSTAPLGTNLITRHVYGLFHCTGEKGYLDELWGQMWFYPYIRSLLDTSIKTLKADTPISDVYLDGRIWKGAKTYPALAAAEGNRSELALGAWADLYDQWLDWEDLCAGHESVLFG